MKAATIFTLAITSASSIVFAQSFDLSDLPGCGYQCVAQIFGRVGDCEFGDFSCFCISQAFLEGFNPCVSAVCRPQDYDAAGGSIQSICLEASITLPSISIPTPTTTITLPSASALADLPDCANTCVTQIWQLSDCAGSDSKCFCDSLAFQFGIVPCVGALCITNFLEFPAISDNLQEFCASAGASTVSVEVTQVPTSIPSEPATGAPTRTSRPATATATEPPSETGNEEDTPSGTQGPSETEPPTETQGGEEPSGTCNCVTTVTVTQVANSAAARGPVTLLGLFTVLIIFIGLM